MILECYHVKTLYHQMPVKRKDREMNTENQSLKHTRTAYNFSMHIDSLNSGSRAKDNFLMKENVSLFLRRDCLLGNN